VFHLWIVLNDRFANNYLIGLTNNLEFREFFLLFQDVSIFWKVIDPVNKTRQNLFYIINNHSIPVVDPLCHFCALSCRIWG